jgi:hypothetical protein
MVCRVSCLPHFGLRYTHAARNKVALVVPSADQGMQGVCVGYCRPCVFAGGPSCVRE